MRQRSQAAHAHGQHLAAKPPSGGTHHSLPCAVNAPGWRSSRAAARAGRRRPLSGTFEQLPAHNTSQLVPHLVLYLGEEGAHLALLHVQPNQVVALQPKHLLRRLSRHTWGAWHCHMMAGRHGSDGNLHVHASGHAHTTIPSGMDGTAWAMPLGIATPKPRNWQPMSSPWAVPSSLPQPLALAFVIVTRFWPQALSSRRVAADTRQCLGGRPCTRLQMASC